MKSVASHPPVKVETTFTIDLCGPLQVPKKVIKGEYCPSGTRGKSASVEAYFTMLLPAGEWISS